MANRSKENVKRFAENISKEMAFDAYNGGGGGGQAFVPIYTEEDFPEAGTENGELAIKKLSDTTYLLFVWEVDESFISGGHWLIPDDSNIPQLVMIDEDTTYINGDFLNMICPDNVTNNIIVLMPTGGVVTDLSGVCLHASNNGLCQYTSPVIDDGNGSQYIVRLTITEFLEEGANISIEKITLSSGGSGADLYAHTIEVTGQNNSTCSVQLVTPESNQYDYYSLAEYIMSRGIPVYEGEVGEETPPDYWYIPTSGVMVIPAQTEEGDPTYGVATRLTASVVGSGGEEQDYNLTIMGIAFDGTQATDYYSNVQDRVTPMVPSNNDEEEENPSEENPSEEE